MPARPSDTPKIRVFVCNSASFARTRVCVGCLNASGSQKSEKLHTRCMGPLELLQEIIEPVALEAKLLDFRAHFDPFPRDPPSRKTYGRAQNSQSFPTIPRTPKSNHRNKKSLFSGDIWSFWTHGRPVNPDRIRSTVPLYSLAIL